MSRYAITYVTYNPTEVRSIQVEAETMRKALADIDNRYPSAITFVRIELIGTDVEAE